MSRGYLLDTGVANLVAIHDVVMQQKLRPLRPLYIPNIVLGELQFGAYWYAYLHQSRKYLDMYEDFYRLFYQSILYSNTETASIYGAIQAELKSRGQLIQQNDTWIAALARQYQLTLLTRDRDYERISGFDMLLM